MSRMRVFHLFHTLSDSNAYASKFIDAIKAYLGFYRTVDWLRRLDGSPTCTNTIPRNPRIGHRTT